MDYTFTLADESALKTVYTLIDKRIKWMDAVGIQQWNVTDYWGVYPKEYYINLVQQKTLYVLKRKIDNKIVGTAAVFDTDERWKGDLDIPAYYVHHLATDINESGAGKAILTFIQELAVKKGKACIRLDCATNNKRLNDYYEQEGYALVGRCVDGDYFGNRREKRL